MLEMAERKRNGWKCLKVAGVTGYGGNSWKWLEWLEMAAYSWTLLELTITRWEWLELEGMAGMAGNDWKLLKKKLARNGWK